MRSLIKSLVVLATITVPQPARAQYPQGYYYPSTTWVYVPANPYAYQNPQPYNGGAYARPYYQQPQYPQAYQQPGYVQPQPYYQQVQYAQPYVSPQQAPYGQPPYYYYPSTTSTPAANAAPQQPAGSNYSQSSRPMPSAPVYYSSDRKASAAPYTSSRTNSRTLPAPATPLPLPVETVETPLDSPREIQIDQGPAPKNGAKRPDDVVQLPDPTLYPPPPAPNQAAIMPPLAPEACPAGDGKQCKKGARLSVFGDFLYWNVHGAEVAFAQPFDGVGPLAAPKGQVALANPRFEPGIRIGAGLATGEHSWLVATGTYFSDVINARTSAPDGSVLQGNVVFPNTVNAAFVPMEADAHYVLRLVTGDIDYKCSVIDTDRWQLNWLAGGRFAHLNQNLSTNYSVFGTTNVTSDIRFDGGGPRAGLEGECQMGCGFFGYGKGIVNLVVGRFDANYIQQATFTGTQAQTSISEERVVPILEGELGVGWHSPKGRIRVSGGYYVGGWLNTMTVPSMVQGVQNNNFTTVGDNFRDTLTFDGLFGRLEFRF